MERWDTMDGISLAQLASIDLRNSEANFGMPFMTVGRIDLHEELLRLALSEEGVGEPVKLVLSSKVVAADSEEGAVELENCETHRGDLIVGADGLHSVLKKVVVGENDLVAASTGMSAFRFSIPTATVLENEMLALLLHSKAHAVSIMADTQDTVNERHMVWYECQGYVSIYSWLFSDLMLTNAVAMFKIWSVFTQHKVVLSRGRKVSQKNPPCWKNSDISIRIF